ncbi:MAG: H+-transporting two-sector ATPase, subunit [Bryobacterales bacterium]|nr:H+-transporting two-sector ATPase, subunit [Bryobacterales bacterium]
MDSTFHALGEILLKGLPTFFLILFLKFYLKRVFFKPLETTLAKRYDVSEGARKGADEALALAEKRIAEYEAALRAARAEIYAEQEAAHRRMQDEQAAAMEKARREAEQFVNSSKAELAAEAELALANLAGQSDALADEIADSILIKGRAA